MDRNKQVLAFRKERKTYQEIADYFGITRQRVMQVLNEIEEYVCFRCGGKNNLIWVDDNWFCKKCKDHLVKGEGFFTSTSASNVLGIDTDDLKKMAKEGRVKYEIGVYDHWLFPKKEIFRLKEELDKEK